MSGLAGLVHHPDPLDPEETDRKDRDRMDVEEDYGYDDTEDQLT